MALFFGCQSPEDVFDGGNGSDTVAPTVPGGLTTSEITDSSVTVSWQPSGDNVAVKAYVLYQDKVQIVTDSLTLFKVANLLPQTIYTYSVRAVDGAGNISRFSPQITVTTLKKVIETDSVERDTIAPLAPKNLIASNTSRTTTDLSWEAASDSVSVSTYKVYRDTTLIVTLPETDYQVTDLFEATEYTFSVSALDTAENESVPSNVVTLVTAANDTVMRDTIPPTVPMNLVVSDTTQTSVDLSWDAATDSVGVAEYRVYQDMALIASLAETTYKVTGLTSDTEYLFSVSALDATENESALSDSITVTTKTDEVVEQDTVPPTIPANLTASDITQNSANLVWDASNDDSGIANYTIFQNGNAIDTVTETNFQVTDLATATAYSYTISATDTAENESAPSDTLVVTTEPAPDTVPPTVPVNLVANTFTETTVDLAWEASTDDSGVVNYTVFRDGNAVATVAETNYQVTGLSAATSYSFTVSASDAAENESDLSDALIVTTEAVPDTVPPTVPANLVANDVTQTSADLSWDASTDDSGVANYTVFQDGSAITTVTETNYQVVGLLAGTSYSFTVSATDTATNESGPSGALTVVTEEVPSTVDKVLVFTKTVEFRHTSIGKGVTTLTALGAANNFEVVQSENSADFNTQNLQQYRLVVFLNTTGDVLNSAQQSAFENYIRAGGSYMGVHAASDTEYDWPWYGQLVGAYFNGHPPIQQANVDVINTNHPSTSHLPTTWVRTDEWYNFRNISSGLNILMRLDESSYSGGTNGQNHPIAWYREFDGGRTFYTGGGHGDAAYDEPDFRAHLLGGIEYCLGR